MKIADIDPLRIINAIHAQDLWADDEITLRDAEGIPTEKWVKLPQVRGFIFDLMRMVEATGLYGVTVERVPAGAGSTMTNDGDRERRVYEIVLKNLPGSTVKIGEEQPYFGPGEVWAWNLPAGQKLTRDNQSEDDSLILTIFLSLA